MKCQFLPQKMVKALVALFTRAWIEMLFELHVSPEGAKSPSSRGRGLKSLDSRSKYTYRPVALFTRAWIEIFLPYLYGRDLFVALFTRAWIEMLKLNINFTKFWSPSSRGLGLKSTNLTYNQVFVLVALFTRAWIEI